MQNRLTSCIFSILLLSLFPDFVLPVHGESVVFGPEYYIRDKGKPQKIREHFTIQNPEGEFTLVVQQGEGKVERVISGRVSSAVIYINGEKVVGPQEFNKRVDMVTEPINLKEENEILVEVRSEPGTSIVVSVSGPEEPSVTEMVFPEGGTVTLEGYASVTFPSGAFPYNTDVTVSATSSAETQDDYSETTVLFKAGPRLPYEIRINSGFVRPNTSFEVLIHVSDTFIASLPSNAKIQVFAQIFHSGEHEILDNFELFPSTFDPVAKTVSLTLPNEAFTDRRHIDDTYEAIIIVGTTPIL